METVGDAYGAMAAQYIERFASPDVVHRDDLDLIEGSLSGIAGAVLDVGCGPGHLTSHLRSGGVAVTGIDLVPAFLAHARAVDRQGRYALGSMAHLPVPDASVRGLLAWYSLIHLPPEEIDAVLGELRRTIVPGGTLVVGFFAGDRPRAFAHAVSTAYYWPVGELSARLARAGFVATRSEQRPGVDRSGHRPHGAVVAVAE